MAHANPALSFYDALPRITQFEVLSEASSYHAVPSDWVVGVADIKGSTLAVAAGQYKTVNMVGAAVLSAQINQMGGTAFPYVFGGDGAVFALAPHRRDGAVKALAAVRRWAKTEFDVELRAAVITVRDILDAGRTLGVARFQASQGVDYAMFRRRWRVLGGEPDEGRSLRYSSRIRRHVSRPDRSVVPLVSR